MSKPNPLDFRVLPINDADLIPIYIGSNVSKPFWVSWKDFKAIINSLIPPAPPGSAVWGSIGTGTGVGSQADLVAYLVANYYPLSSNPASYVTASQLTTALLSYVTTSALATALLGYVPTSRTITINGVTYDLSANRSWTIPSGGSPGGSNTQVQYNDGGAFGGDATFTFNETTKVIGVDSLQFSLSPVTGPGAGLISYNGATGALAYKLNSSNVQSEIGETLHALVHNAEAVTITKGQAVYLYQATGNKASVKLAFNTSDATSAKTFGLAAEDIPAGNNGFVICQGVLDGLNTGMFSAGDTLYLGATAGSYTATKPYAPNHLVYIGIVERANAGNGQIYVKTQNGYELDEIHDVDLITTPPVNNDVLTYITGSPNLWKPRSVSSLVPSNLKTGSFGVTVDGVSTVVSVGQVGFVVIPYSGTITGWSITANAVGSIQFDVWKAAGAIPTIANTIVAGAFPTLTAGQFVTSATLTGWTTAFSAGDVFGFYVNSTSTIKNATLTIRTTKS